MRNYIHKLSSSNGNQSSSTFLLIFGNEQKEGVKKHLLQSHVKSLRGKFNENFHRIANEYQLWIICWETLLNNSLICFVQCDKSTNYKLQITSFCGFLWWIGLFEFKEGIFWGGSESRKLASRVSHINFPSLTCLHLKCNKMHSEYHFSNISMITML